MAVSNSPGSRELFEEWTQFAELIKDQGAIMQNPIVLTMDMILEWVDANHRIISMFPDLVSRTYKIIWEHSDDELKAGRK